MSAVVRVITDLGALLNAQGEVDIHLGHAPASGISDIAISFRLPATPGSATMQWLLFVPTPLEQRYLGEGTFEVSYDNPRQLLTGLGPFTVDYMKLLVLKLSLTEGLASSLGATIITVTFKEPARAGEMGD